MTTFEARVAILKAEYQRLEQYLHTLSQGAGDASSTWLRWAATRWFPVLPITRQRRRA